LVVRGVPVLASGQFDRPGRDVEIGGSFSDGQHSIRLEAEGVEDITGGDGGNDLIGSIVVSGNDLIRFPLLQKSVVGVGDEYETVIFGVAVVQCSSIAPCDTLGSIAPLSCRFRKKTAIRLIQCEFCSRRLSGKDGDESIIGFRFVDKETIGAGRKGALYPSITIGER
jgi:hypothetical protein